MVTRWLFLVNSNQNALARIGGATDTFPMLNLFLASPVFRKISNLPQRS
jgi:hypothetical protein